MIEIDFTPGPMERLLDYVIEHYLNIEGLCPNTGLSVDRPQCVKCNYERHRGGGKPLYSCQNFRKVYLIRFLITHTKQTCDLIRRTIISDIAKIPNLFVVSFGGGPGVEALALMELLRHYDGKYDFVFDNVDRELSWQPIYQDLVRTFSGWIKNVDVNPRFSQIDVTGDFLAKQYDIVFVPWILSELDKEGRHRVLSRARDLTQPSKYVVVTDRPESALIRKISESITSIQAWDVIKSEPKFKKHCGIHFPDDLRAKFRAQVEYSTAYWVLKKHEVQDVPF